MVRAHFAFIPKNNEKRFQIQILHTLTHSRTHIGLQLQFTETSQKYERRERESAEEKQIPCLRRSWMYRMRNLNEFSLFDNCACALRIAVWAWVGMCVCVSVSMWQCVASTTTLIQRNEFVVINEQMYLKKYYYRVRSLSLFLTLSCFALTHYMIATTTAAIIILIAFSSCWLVHLILFGSFAICFLCRFGHNNVAVAKTTTKIIYRIPSTFDAFAIFFVLVLLRSITSFCFYFWTTRIRQSFQNSISIFVLLLSHWVAIGRCLCLTTQTHTCIIINQMNLLPHLIQEWTIEEEASEKKTNERTE